MLVNCFFSDIDPRLNLAYPLCQIAFLFYARLIKQVHDSNVHHRHCCKFVGLSDEEYSQTTQLSHQLFLRTFLGYQKYFPARKSFRQSELLDAASAADMLLEVLEKD